MSVDATRDKAAPLIELSHVSKVYGGTTVPVCVLNDVSLTIGAGEFVAIMGASGSGKSTLMNVLGCLDRPSSGSYRFAGRDVATFEADDLAMLRRETFGFVFQQYHLVRGLTAQENVEVPAVYRGVPAAERRTRAQGLLAQLGLGQRGHHRPDQLSGGQQQRVSIARALMNGGRVLLADEPTGALDKTSGTEVMSLLRELSLAGHTVIIVTHDRAVANEARRTIEISDGRIVADSGRDEAAVPRYDQRREPGTRPYQAALFSSTVEAVRAAFRALSLNVARTLLTLLGIVVGVAAVVALLAIGEGTKRAVMRELQAFGANRLYVNPEHDEDSRIGGPLRQLEVDLVADVPHVAAAMPYLTGWVTVRAGRVDRGTNAVAATTLFPRIVNWPVDEGSFFTTEDEERHATVAVL
ncbi:MAG: ATP-binding cassette domain-containing protein, partial [Polyangiales bacterium]